MGRCRAGGRTFTCHTWTCREALRPELLPMLTLVRQPALHVSPILAWPVVPVRRYRVGDPADYGAAAVRRRSAYRHALTPGTRLELHRLCEALTDDTHPGRPHAVTVAGVGGVGKSALAVHAAHPLRDRFPDGQLYLDLHGFGTRPPRSPHEALATFLADLPPVSPGSWRSRADGGRPGRSAWPRSVRASARPSPSAPTRPGPAHGCGRSGSGCPETCGR